MVDSVSHGNGSLNKVTESARTLTAESSLIQLNFSASSRNFLSSAIRRYRPEATRTRKFKFPYALRTRIGSLSLRVQNL